VTGSLRSGLVIEPLRETAHTLIVRVASTPAPQGSKRAIVHRSTGKAVVMESAGGRLTDWRADVRAAVIDAMRRTGYESSTGPVEVRLLFYLRRPAGH